MTKPRLPAIFVGHGAPTTALDAAKGQPLAAWGEALPRPRAIVCVSAHWERAPVTVGTVDTRPLMYDFRGFPQALYEVDYPSPGAPAVASRVRALVDGTDGAPARPLDHGVWTPLVHMFPEHDVPVLQLSLPSSLGAAAVVEMGRRLAPLREEGVLVMGSGNVTHNLRSMGPDGAAPQAWAADFDAWVAETLKQGEVDRLVDAATHAPAFRQNHPTLEHWLPLHFAVGAGSDDLARVSFPVDGFEFENLSRRSVQLG